MSPPACSTSALLVILATSLGACIESTSESDRSGEDSQANQDAGSSPAEAGQTPSLAGLHRACPTTGCTTGQDCVSQAGPDGTTQTCEVRCTASSECPAPLRCNLPPIAPDSIPNVCVEP